MHHSDDLMFGPVYVGGNSNNSAGSSPMGLGVGPMGRVYIFDAVPLAKNTTNLATAQAVAGAGNLTLTAGTGVTSTTDATGVVRLVLDCERCVDVVSSNAGDTTQTVTVYGYDRYGFPMSQAVALNGVTRVATTKAFKQIYRIAVSAAAAGNVSAGTTDVIGLPYRLLSRDYIVGANFNATAVALSAFTIADATSPATTATTDVRGLLTLPSAADGIKRAVIAMALPAIACGPSATRVGAVGVTQV